MVRAGSALLVLGSILGACTTPTKGATRSLHCRATEVETADAKHVWRGDEAPPFILPGCLDIFGSRAEVEYWQGDEALRIPGTLDRTGAFRPDAPSPYATIEGFTSSPTGASAAVTAPRSADGLPIPDATPENWRVSYACIEGVRSDGACGGGCCYDLLKPQEPR